MKKSELLASLKENWWLLILLGLCIAGTIGAFLRPTAGPISAGAGGAPAMVSEHSVEVEVSDESRRETARERVLADMRDYQAQYDADPESEDAPALLFAIGNLNLHKFGDYQEAARCYELVVASHPDWNNLYMVFPQLVTCYEQLKDKQGLRWVYGEMVKRYPEDTQEYQYAQSLKEQF